MTPPDAPPTVTVAQTAHNLASALQLAPQAARYLVTAYAAQLGYAVTLPGPAPDDLTLSTEDARSIVKLATDLASKQATHDEEALRRVQDARVALDAATAARDIAEGAWRSKVVQAIDEGWPLTVVAKAAGVSRSRVHQIAQEDRS